ncbi:hypothetical protein BDL97_08G106900 [Sphagnum fallax]|nr:hypothetical protein BDL97_08G106900 [Sphagnum fallax]KAH8954931.1 hypothetical protein BDL97_08G106900 [Sphagnum fallax]
MAEAVVDIDVGTQPFDLAFHPSASLVAVSLITGRLHLYEYGDGRQPERKWNVSAHSESCRAVRFTGDGRLLLTGSPDCSIVATDVETGQAVARLTGAHGAAINRIINATDWSIASGDDEGTIKVWDTRQNVCCSSFKAHDDFVADMEFVPDSMQLLGASGDGTLSICNLRRNRVDGKSQFAEDELLSVVMCKDGRKVVCGSQDGVLLLYSWGHMLDCSDRFIGHPNSVDALLKVDEDTLLTGSMDGIIRVVTILPNKMIGVIGEHAEYPIERLAFSHDRTTLGSVSHDNTVKLWDVKYLQEGDDEASEGVDTKQQASLGENAGSQGNGQTDSTIISGDDSDDEMEAEGSRRRKKKGKQPALPSKGKSKFFEDL